MRERTKLNNEPLVTIYMPTYNRVNLLKRAVESVLNQDYNNIELIVVDDNSTDTTQQYLDKIAKKDSRFFYFINNENLGACASRNKAIRLAKGEFITGIDDDDYFLASRISDFLECWNEKNSSFVALYSNTYIKKQNGSLTKYARPSKCSYQDLISGNWIGNQIFTKTSTLRHIGGFDEKLLSWQDLECWFRLLKIYNLSAYRCNKYNYVIDISHSHERITTKKTSNVIESYNYICNKYNLSLHEKKILKLQLNPYLNNSLDLKSMIKAIVYTPSFNSVKHYSRMYLASKIKNIVYKFAKDKSN